MRTESLVAWDECDEVLRRRYQEALEAGMTDEEADRFARSGSDISILRRLVAKGCPSWLVARVVL